MLHSHPGTTATAEQLPAGGLHFEGGFIVDQRDEGLRLWTEKNYFKPASVLALTIGPGQHRSLPNLYVIEKSDDPNYGTQHMKYDLTTASSGGFQNPATIEKLSRLQPLPVREQLQLAGFKPIGQADGVTSILRWEDKKTNPARPLELLAVLATDDDYGERFTRLFEPVEGFGMDIDGLIRKSHIIGIGATKEQWYEEAVPTLRLSSGALEYSVKAKGASAGRPFDVEQVHEMSATELGIVPMTEQLEPTGFILGGVNETGVIERLPSITGVPIDELTRRMRPGQYSQDGFLGQDDNLLETLMHDNNTVQKLELTHAQIAEPLRMIEGLSRLGVRTAIFGGKHYAINAMGGLGIQESPFSDNLQGSLKYTVTCIETGDSISFSSLGAKLIARYGFYEGPGTTYRSAPEDIVKVFPHLLGQ